MSNFDVFVFGSNLAGRHGKGAALTAKLEYGAVYGVGSGRTGNAYAIPTKDGNLSTLPLKKIKMFVDDFITYAEINPDLTFGLTKIGSGLAGYDWDSEIRPLFPEQLPSNVSII